MLTSLTTLLTRLRAMPERDPLLTELPSLADAPADVRAAAVADEAYWKKLCPSLAVAAA